MKPIPFPLAVNIGTDIVHLPRITRLLQQPNYLTRFTRRILSDQEQLDFQTRFLNNLQTQKQPTSFPTTPFQTPITPEMTRWLAGRFAAKEAARKAAPGGAAALGWKDVVIRVPEASEILEGQGTSTGMEANVSQEQEGISRRPEIVFRGNGKDQPDRLGRLSISHDGEYVIATVLAAG